MSTDSKDSASRPGAIQQFVQEWLDAHDGDMVAAIQGLATAYIAAEQEVETLRSNVSGGYSRRGPRQGTD